MSHSSFMKDMRNGMSMQARVVGALILREMQTRYGRENIGYLWALIEPLILLSMFLIVFYYHGRTSHSGMNLVSFLTTGIMTFQSMRKIVTNVSKATDANQSLLLYPQVTPTDTMVARLVLESATFIVLFFVIIGGGWLVGLATLPHDLLGVLIALLACCMLGVSIGLFQNALLTVFPLAERLLAPLWRFLFFTSCVFYSMADLPVAAQPLVALNPIANLIELLRQAFFSQLRSPIQDYWYVAQWIVGCTFTGLLIERMYRNKETVF